MAKKKAAKVKLSMKTGPATQKEAVKVKGGKGKRAGGVKGKK